MKDTVRNTIPAAVIVIALAVLSYFVPATPQMQSSSGLNSTFNVVQLNIQLNGTNTPSTYYAYVATTQAQQEQGYMNQTNLGDCRGMSPCIGMLFVFNTTYNLCFWMKNTGLPLKQLWIATNGTVVYEYDGAPYSTEAVCYTAQSVLETSDNQALPAGSKVIVT